MPSYLSIEIACLYGIASLLLPHISKEAFEAESEAKMAEFAR